LKTGHGIEVLVVDDEQKMRDLLSRALTKDGFKVSTAKDGPGALAVIDRHMPDVVLADLRMPGMDGLMLLYRINERPHRPVVVLMTAFGTVDSAVEAIKAGAFDYLTKPFKVMDVSLVLAKAAREVERRAEVSALRELVDQRYGLDAIVGSSKQTQQLRDMVRTVATRDVTVLIQGNTGTGKELVARAIHNLSPRVGRRFLAVNCTALPETLFESELFGHVRGAFTGAHADRKGLLQEAEGGTVFLDEVGDLPALSQTKLLRFLQEHKVRQVGGNREVDVDVRILAATNRDLDEAMRSGKLREDLYYRLNVVSIHVPDLADRPDDISPLVEHFVAEAAKRDGRPAPRVTSDVMRVFLAYSWPGNIRQLEHIVERMVMLREGDTLTRDDVPDEVLSSGVRRSQPDRETKSTGELSLTDMERMHIMYVLEQCGGHRSRAAEILGIDRRTLYRRLREYQSESPKS
jgi:two-component system response regulator AtoC